MNYKIECYKERLQRMLMLIKRQEQIEEFFDNDPGYVKQQENQMIEEFAAELAALNQLAFKQIAEYKNNARPLGTITINSEGKAEKEKDLLVQEKLS